MFLAVLRRTVIDRQFQVAIPAVVEDLTSIPPIVGVSAVPEVAEVSHEEIAKVFIESSGQDIAANISNANLDYYDIKFNPQLKPSLRVIRERVGARAVAPAEEFLVVENEDGEEIASLAIAI